MLANLVIKVNCNYYDLTSLHRYWLLEVYIKAFIQNIHM